jgi:hypothetical protein
MGGSGWLATCLDCSCPARTPWSVAATHRLDKIRRRAAQPYTIVSLSIQYFRNASHLDCRQLEKEKSARKNSYMHTHRVPANGRNFKSAVYSRTFAHAHGDTDAFFAHQRPNKAITVLPLPSAHARANYVLPVLGRHRQSVPAQKLRRRP